MATYTSLSEELRPLADKVYHLIKNKWGLKSIKVESIDFDVSFVPTFCGTTKTSKVCVEVNNSFYPATLNEFVADCISLGLPIKLYSAVPANPDHRIDQAAIQRAGKFGVGCLVVDGGKVSVLREAIDLSLFLNEQEKNTAYFPKKLRSEIHSAIITYQNGDPKKGVSNLFDTIEGIIRKIAIQAKARGEIPASNTADLNRASWVSVMELMSKHAVLPPVFLNQCIGSSTMRNYTSHPSNLKEIQKMHRRLKTHYNSAIDLLKDLIDEAKKKRYKI